MVDGNTEKEKDEGCKKNVVGIISHNEHKDILLNKKCLTHSMNSIQSNDHRIRTYEINKIYLSCVDDNIYI